MQWGNNKYKSMGSQFKLSNINVNSVPFKPFYKEYFLDKYDELLMKEIFNFKNNL